MNDPIWIDIPPQQKRRSNHEQQSLRWQLRQPSSYPETADDLGIQPGRIGLHSPITLFGIPFGAVWHPLVALAIVVLLLCLLAAFHLV